MLRKSYSSSKSSPKIKINHQFEDADGSLGTRSKLDDFGSLQRRIFIRIKNLMDEAVANRTIVPAVNAYNYGQYEEAQAYFQEAISICQQVWMEIHPHLEICERVNTATKDQEDLAYEERVSRWEAKFWLIKWLSRSPEFKIRCKYCGHYTPYIDPNYGVAYFGQNNCIRCGRSYPTPDFSWDGIDGQAYIYYRRSVPEEEFYRKFEVKYDVSPDSSYFLEEDVASQEFSRLRDYIPHRYTNQ